jgi:hypothetical protein
MNLQGVFLFQQTMGRTHLFFLEIDKEDIFSFFIMKNLKIIHLHTLQEHYYSIPPFLQLLLL